MNTTRATVSATITAAEIARIASRHPDIPQDALPIAAVPQRETTNDESGKPRSPKSIKWARCPHHTPSGKRQLTGLILSGKGSLIFREHSKSVGKFTVRCPGSGVQWDEMEVA